MRPTYLADSIKFDAQGNPTLKPPAEHIIVDLAESSTEGDFDEGFDNVMIVVGVWAEAITTAFRLQRQVRALLIAEGWQHRTTKADRDGNMRVAEAFYVLEAAF